MHTSTAPNRYPALRQFDRTHAVVQVLRGSPPVFVALKRSAIEYRHHATGPLASVPEDDQEQRVSAVLKHLASVFSLAWASMPSELKSKALKCWSMCCDEDSEHWCKRRTNAAVVFEVTNIQSEHYGCAVGVKECGIEVELDIRCVEGEQEDAFLMAVEIFGEWFDEHCEPTPTEPEPKENIHEFLPIVDDFPLSLAIRKKLLERQAHIAGKLIRAFKDAWAECTPTARSQVRSAWGAFWSRKKWGIQDPNAKAMVIVSRTAECDEFALWDPALRAIIIHERFAVNSPEHELMKAFASELESASEFGKKPPRLLPIAIEQRFRQPVSLKP